MAATPSASAASGPELVRALTRQSRPPPCARAVGGHLGESERGRMLVLLLLVEVDGGDDAKLEATDEEVDDGAKLLARRHDGHVGQGADLDDVEQHNIVTDTMTRHLPCCATPGEVRAEGRAVPASRRAGGAVGGVEFEGEGGVWG